MKTSFFGTKWAFHDFLQNLQKLKILNKWNLFFCSCLIFNLLFLGLSSISYGYTVDVGKSVEEVLEYETLKGSCDTYWSLIENDEESEKIRIFERKCGKWLFLFWETSGELPLPIMLYDAMRRSWPDLTGDHFEKLGFIKNPYSPEGWPVGVVRSTKKYMGLPSINVNCASCHVGKLPDGRYAVGAPNTELDMSQFNLMSYYSVYIAMNKEEKKILSPEVVAYYENLKRLERRRYRDENGKIDWSNSVFKYSYLLSILGIGTKGLPDADYVKMPPAADLKSWLDGRPGVFNPGAPMLTVQVTILPPPTSTGVDAMASRMRSATITAPGTGVSDRKTMNSSPPYRAGTSLSRNSLRIAIARCLSSRLPASWPCVSFTVLRLSESIISMVAERLYRTDCASRRFAVIARPRRLKRPVSSSTSASTFARFRP